MLRKVFLPICVAVVITLAIASAAHAWGVYHYSYHTGYGGYGGAYRYGGAYHYGYGGGGYHYGYVRRW
jgi:hypothetical protein